MTQTYLDMPETGDESPDRPWAIKVSLAISAVWILFSLAAWTWANGQRVDYGDLDFGEILGRNGFGYVGVYLGIIFVFGTGVALVVGVVFGYQVVSSDIANRLRESGKTVYVLGENKAPDALKNACDKFIDLEVVQDEKKTDGDELPDEDDETPAPTINLQSALTRALNAVADDEGWATLASLGNQLTRTYPSFDANAYSTTDPALFVNPVYTRAILGVAPDDNVPPLRDPSVHLFEADVVLDV